MKSQWRISKTGDARQQADDSNRQPAVCANDARSPLPLLVLLLVWMWPAVVQAQLEYRIENGTITITGYSGPGGAVTIPDTIHGLPVTAIGWGTFCGWSTMTSVSIPESVTRIEGLVFSGCVRLTSIEVDPHNPVYSSLDGVLLNKSQTTLIQCPPGKVGSYTIPDSVSIIENRAFDGCGGLTNIEFPNSITTIGREAFQHCTNLISLTLPEGLTSLEPRTFDGCIGLASVTLPESLTRIGMSAFSMCTSLTSITIPDSVTDIGPSAFVGCSSLTTVTLPESLTCIGMSAFSMCTSLTSVTIPGKVTSIGPGAFSSCASLTSITIPDSVTSIGYSAFIYCTNLAGVVIPAGVTRIENWTFMDCSSLTDLVIPDGVTSIGDWAFARCTSLISIMLPKTIASIGKEVFTGCTSLMEISVDVDNAYFSSAEGVLFNQNQTMLIRCPGGKVGTYTIPASVTEIEIDAFSDCANVMEIRVDADNTAYSSLDGVLFNKNRTVLIRFPEGRSGRYTVPDGVTSIKSHAFRNCAGLTSVTIPASVISIEGISFYECTSLTSLYFQGDAPATYGRLGAGYATLFYMPGTTGWDAHFNRRPTVLWDPRVQTRDGSLGVRMNRFGFNITASNDVMVVVEACLDPTDPTWVQLGTHTLTGGSFYFTDPQWAQHPARYYRLRMP